MTLTQTAITASHDAALSVAGIRANYRRLNPAVVQPITALVGKSNIEVATDYGVIVQETRDFITKALPFSPQTGDRIEQVIGDTVYVYEVRSPSGEHVYTSADPMNAIWRIHTQLIDTQ